MAEARVQKPGRGPRGGMNERLGRALGSQGRRPEPHQGHAAHGSFVTHLPGSSWDEMHGVRGAERGAEEGWLIEQRVEKPDEVPSKGGSGKGEEACVSAGGAAWGATPASSAYRAGIS